MSRNRAERRYNTHVKTSARKARAIRLEAKQFPSHGYCGGKISLNGEASSCALCNTANEYMADYRRRYVDLQIDSFMKAIAE